MMRDPLTPERVLELIDAYGADTDRWPVENRDAAVELMDAQPQLFADALAAAKALDLAVSNIDDVPDISPGLEMLILQGAPAPAASVQDVQRPASGSTSKVKWSTGAVLAGLMTGLLGGYAYAASTTTSFDQAESAYDAMLGDSDLVFLLSEEAP